MAKKIGDIVFFIFLDMSVWVGQASLTTAGCFAGSHRGPDKKP